VENDDLINSITTLYQNKCQVSCCKKHASGLTYIQPPNHYGENKSNNSLVLCEAHKEMLGKGEITIDVNHSIILHINQGHILHNKKIHIKHKMNKKAIDYHQIFIWKGLNTSKNLGNLYYIKLNDDHTIKGIYVGAIGERKYYLKVKKPTDKEIDLLNMNRKKVSIKYNMSRKEVDKFRSTNVLTYIKHNSDKNLIINNRHFYVVENKQCKRISQKVRTKHARIARERCKKINERIKLFNELKVIQKQIEQNKLVSKKSQYLEQRKNILSNVLNLSEGGRKISTKTHVPSRVKIRARHYK